MSQKTILISCAFLATIILMVNLWALNVSLYWRYRWFDIPMHLAGGFLIGLIGIVIFRWVIEGAMSSPRIELAMIGVAVLLALTAGLAWELIECMGDHWIGLAIHLQNAHVLQLGIGDTIKDLVDDMLGGLIAGSLMLKLTRRQARLPGRQANNGK